MSYILILVWIGFIAILDKIGNFQTVEVINKTRKYRYPMWFAVLVFIPIFWIVGHRGNFEDTTAYAISFSRMPDSLSDIPHYISMIQKDKGFYVLSCLIKTFIGSNRIWYFTILAIIQGIPLIVVYRKYSSNYLVSIFLFLASTDYIAWMYNGIRQFTAVTIIFAATTLMLKKKYIPLLIIILLASTVHQSALIMIPIVFIAQGNAWNKKTLFFLFLAVLAVAFVGEFTDIMDDALVDTQYSDMVSSYTSFNDDGTNPLRVLIYSIPAIISFVGRKKIQGLKDPLINLCTNMSLVSMGIYIVSMFTSGIYIGRLPIYVSLYGYILLPWEIENIFYDSKKMIYAAIVGFYLLFYFYQVFYVWNILSV